MKQAANRPAPEFQISFVNKYVAIAVMPLHTIHHGTGFVMHMKVSALNIL